MDRHANPTALLLEVHFVSKRLYQEKTSAVFALDILFRARVRDPIRVEPHAFVLYADVYALITDINIQKDFFPFIELVAMLYGVDNHLVNKQLGAACLIVYSVQVSRRKGVRLVNQPRQTRVATSRGYLQTLRSYHGHLCIPCVRKT